jgi:hypothetical protein
LAATTFLAAGFLAATAAFFAAFFAGLDFLSAAIFDLLNGNDYN